MPTRIFGRPWSKWATAPFASSHYVDLWNTFAISRRPFDDLSRYAFKKGSYPYVCRVRTPLGDVEAELGSWHDMLTVNEVFFRLDYRTPSNVRTVVDVGSNIGLSALYFLTRNEHVHCHLAEPDPRNIERLRKNLAPFADRYTLNECAVADYAGSAAFGLESTGRYGGIDLELDETIIVPCREINSFLEEVIAEAGHIDVVKMDMEGLEERTVRAIRPEILRRIGLIYLEWPEALTPIDNGSLATSHRRGTGAWSLTRHP